MDTCTRWYSSLMFTHHWTMVEMALLQMDISGISMNAMKPVLVIGGGILATVGQPRNGCPKAEESEMFSWTGSGTANHDGP